MSGQNVILLDPSRRVVRRVFLGESTIGMLIFLVFDAMILAGMVGAFMLTRATEAGVWPPADQPWFPLRETVINTAVLLCSGALVFLAVRAWKKRAPRFGLLLLAAILLGAFFMFVQGVVWVGLVRDGLNLATSPHGKLFYLIVGTHGAHVLVGLVLLGVAWLRLKPLLDGEQTQGPPSSSAFVAVCIFWYFVVGIWPILYVCLYL